MGREETVVCMLKKKKTQTKTDGGKKIGKTHHGQTISE